MRFCEQLIFSDCCDTKADDKIVKFNDQFQLFAEVALNSCDVVKFVYLLRSFCSEVWSELGRILISFSVLNVVMLFREQQMNCSREKPDFHCKLTDICQLIWSFAPDFLSHQRTKHVQEIWGAFLERISLCIV